MSCEANRFAVPDDEDDVEPGDPDSVDASPLVVEDTALGVATKEAVETSAWDDFSTCDISIRRYSFRRKIF
jgi:hypothetical protein